MQEKEKMFLELNSVLVRFWIENGRPDREVKIELLERMLNWYKKMGHVTLDKQEEKKLPEGLEEAARRSEILTYPMPEDGDIEKVMKVQEARIFHEIGFKAGAEWMKAKMLEDAVEGKVFMSFAPGHNQMVMADVDLPTNTKVKVIIVKED